MSNIFIISAPSGAGKSSLIDGLIANYDSIKKSVSVTTRKPREGEKNGEQYIFTDEADFKKRLDKKEFLEHAHVHGNWYGTSKLLVESELNKNHDLILEIDFQGAQVVRTHYPNSISIFILPPSMAVLRARLEKRNTDSASVIERRLDAATSEIGHVSEYQYVIINEVYEDALSDLGAIIRSADLRNSTSKSKEIVKNHIKG